MELFDNVKISIFPHYLCIFVRPCFFWISVQHHLWSTCLYNKSRFGSSTPALLASISCVRPSLSACVPPFLYQSTKIAPLESLHSPFEILFSLSQIPLKQRPIKKKILLFLISAPLWPLPIPLEQFIEASIYANFHWGICCADF